VGSPTAAAAAAASTSNHDQTLQEAVDALNSRSTDAKVLVGLKRLINLSLNSHDHAVQFVQMGGVAGVNSVLKVRALCVVVHGLPAQASCASTTYVPLFFIKRPPMLHYNSFFAV